MEFRKSEAKDVKGIMKIIDKAKDYLKSKGINQWQNGYPNESTIIEDIDNENSYVLTLNNEIIGTTALFFEIEKTYNNIYDGKWKTLSDYTVIHRIAIDENLKGKNIGEEIIKEIEKITLKRNIHSIKVDTHRNNKSMRNFLKKNGFEYCGIIYIEDGSERLAFEKTI